MGSGILSVLVMFEVELISFIDNKAADEYDALDSEEKDKMSVTDLVDVANSLREVDTHTHTHTHNISYMHSCLFVCLSVGW